MGDLNGILVTVEGWGVNLAGCYGNSLLPTPSIDRLAAHGIVFDHFWMHSLELEPNLEAIIQGMIPSQWLVATDSRRAMRVLRTQEDLERLEVEVKPDRESFEYLLSESLESWLQQRDQTPFLWIHSRGLYGPWDAPYELRKLMCDQDDPEPPTDLAMPDVFLTEGYDPDTLFGYACGAGAQSQCIDQGVGLIQQTLKEFGIDQNCWVSIAGLLGFPLGEHRRVGFGNQSDSGDVASEKHPAGYSERLHTPWIIRPAPQLDLGTRLESLVQPSDLGAWIERMSSGDSTNDLRSLGVDLPIAWATGSGEIVVVTQRWIGRFDTTVDSAGEVLLSDSVGGEVYCFPEDRWQQNEIASRVPQVQSLLARIVSILLSDSQGSDSNSILLSSLLAELSAIRR